MQHIFFYKILSPLLSESSFGVDLEAQIYSIVLAPNEVSFLFHLPTCLPANCTPLHGFHLLRGILSTKCLAASLSGIIVFIGLP
jgi:hypothetical protein